MSAMRAQAQRSVAVGHTCTRVCPAGLQEGVQCCCYCMPAVNTFTVAPNFVLSSNEQLDSPHAD